MPKDSIVRFKKLKEMTGVSRSTISRWEKAGHFPAHVIVGRNSVGWYQSEVQEWLDSRPRGFLER